MYVFGHGCFAASVANGDPQNGIFRGLAFANFRHPSEADATLAALNGYDLQGRRLRVEYKRVLRAGEKERIERDKAIKRMRSAAGVGAGNAWREPSTTEEDDFGSIVAPTPGFGFSANASPYEPRPMAVTSTQQVSLPSHGFAGVGMGQIGSPQSESGMSGSGYGSGSTGERPRSVPTGMQSQGDRPKNGM